MTTDVQIHTQDFVKNKFKFFIVMQEVCDALSKLQTVTLFRPKFNKQE